MTTSTVQIHRSIRKRRRLLFNCSTNVSVFDISVIVPLLAKLFKIRIIQDAGKGALFSFEFSANSKENQHKKSPIYIVCKEISSQPKRTITCGRVNHAASQICHKKYFIAARWSVSVCVAM